jgi:hypothetical protein
MAAAALCRGFGKPASSTRRIIPDADERLGQPDICNGICMSKIHHAAYDAGLIAGGYPQGRIRAMRCMGARSADSRHLS